MLETDETSTRRVLGRRRVVGQVGGAPTPAPEAGPDGGEGRRRLLRPVRRGDGDDRGTFDLRNTWQVLVGSLLIPLGVVFILIAWNGAAHAKVDQGHITNLIGGGLIRPGLRTDGRVASSSGATGSTGCSTRPTCTTRSRRR